MTGDRVGQCGVGSTTALALDSSAPARGFSRRRHIDLLRVSTAMCPGMTPAGALRG